MGATNEIRSPGRAVISQAAYVFTVISVVGLTFSIAVSSIAMGIAIVLWVYLLIASKQQLFPGTSLDFFFLLYVVSELLACAFAVTPVDSFVNMKRLLLISIVYLVLQFVNSEAKLKVFLGLLIGVTALLSTVEILSATSVGGHFLRASLYQHYMTEGGIKMFVLLLCVPFLVHASTPARWRIALFLSSAVLLVGLILTQTRSSWLGFIAGVVTIGFLKNKKVILLLVGLVVLFVLLAPADFRTRAASIVDPSQVSNLSRIHMITTGWKMFLDHPLFGTGDIDLRKLYVTYITPIDSAEGGHLHNNFMMLLATLGIVGFVSTMMMFVKIFLVELRAVRSTRGHVLFESLTIGSLAAYVGFHVNGLFEWNFGDHEIAVLLWFTVGVALVAQRLGERIRNGGLK